MKFPVCSRELEKTMNFLSTPSSHAIPMRMEETVSIGEAENKWPLVSSYVPRGIIWPHKCLYQDPNIWKASMIPYNAICCHPFMATLDKKDYTEEIYFNGLGDYKSRRPRGIANKAKAKSKVVKRNRPRYSEPRKKQDERQQRKKAAKTTKSKNVKAKPKRRSAKSTKKVRSQSSRPKKQPASKRKKQPAKSRKNLYYGETSGTSSSSSVTGRDDDKTSKKKNKTRRVSRLQKDGVMAKRYMKPRPSTVEAFSSRNMANGEMIEHMQTRVNSSQVLFDTVWKGISPENIKVETSVRFLADGNKSSESMHDRELQPVKPKRNKSAGKTNKSKKQSARKITKKPKTAKKKTAEKKSPKTKRKSKKSKKK